MFYHTRVRHSVSLPNKMVTKTKALKALIEPMTKKHRLNLKV